MKVTDKRATGRRRIHSNRHKRIRKGIETALSEAGVLFADVYDRQLNCYTVPSQTHNVYIKRELSHDFPSLEDWGMPVQVLEGTALQWVIDPYSPRGIYQRVKKRVQAARRTERKGILRQLRDRARRGVADAMEHARTTALQQQYEAVPGLQGLGVSNPAEGAGSDQGERRLPDMPRAGEDQP